MSLDFGPVQTLGFAVLVLYIGIFLIKRLRFLGDNNIPVPVVGGFLFALIASFLLAEFNICFGPAPQAFIVLPLMVAFFIDLLNAIVIQLYLILPITVSRYRQKHTLVCI